MENENKNKGNGKQHRRHKSYFISPSANSNENALENNSAAVATSDATQKNQHRKNKNKSSGAPKQDAQASVQSVNTASATEQPEKNSVSDNKNRKNKPKHKKPSDNNNKEAQNPRANTDIQSNLDKSNSDFDFSKFDKLEKPAQKKLESFASSPEYQKYKDYEEFTYDQMYGSIDEKTQDVPTPSKDVEPTDATVEVIEEKPVEEIEVVGIRFKASGKTYYFTPNNLTLRMGLHAIVETARGLEYGEVVMSNSFIPESEIVPPLRPVVRIATTADTLHNEEIKKLEESAFRICNEKIIAHKLDMKLIDAQYTFDNSKLLFYFTSAGRVDFRELVKDLASVFRTRIELRQIGIRDEAKMVGGLGMCGRPLCCSKFLTDFGQVSIKMAKEQNLSLNSAKISGICGRLMCCLRYEHDTYEYEIKRTPPVDTLVRTVDGVGTVTEISPLQSTIKVRLAATPEVMPKSYKREEVTILKKKD